MEKKTRNILIIFLIAMIARIIFSFSFFVHWWDESVYLSLGYDLSKNFFHYTLLGAGWSDFIPGGIAPYAWPNLGFRAPLFPYLLSFFYYIKASFIIPFLDPIIGAFSAVVVYFLGKDIFSEKIGIYSAMIFALIPFNILQNSMIMTGTLSTFFILLTFLFFWRGFEKNIKGYKILFGVTLALALLARYTVLWIIPVFLFYFLVRDRNFKFLKDGYLWYSIIAFFMIMIPWFIYGIMAYGNPLGGFIHGVMAASYWGGTQSFFFYFQNSWEIFSVVGIIFLISLIPLVKKRLFRRKGFYLLLIWLGFFLLMSCFVAHKEERFILPIIAPVALLSGYFIMRFKKYSKWILLLILAILLLHGIFMFSSNYRKNHTGTYDCFYNATMFLKTLPGNPLIITDESPIVYSYTHLRARYYPAPWSIKALNESIVSSGDQNDSYIFYTDMDMPLYENSSVEIKDSLDSSFAKVFSCDYDWGMSVIYKFSDNSSSQQS